MERNTTAATCSRLEGGVLTVNPAFADAVLEELDAAGRRRLLPRCTSTRARLVPQRPAVPIAHFTHIPWVDEDDWSVLPVRES